MKHVLSINSFGCYLQAWKISVVILWSVALYYASSLEWIKRRKNRSDVSRWNIHSGSFSCPISLAPTEGTCTGLVCSDWSIRVSFMLVLVSLSLHRNWSFFIELFQHIYGWVVIILYAQRYFLHDTYCCLHSTSISFIAGGREVI